MTEPEHEQNFNREIESILERAEKRIGELKELRAGTLQPWEKKWLFEQILRLEKDGSRSSKNIQWQLEELEKSLKRLWIDFAVTFSLLLLIVGIFAWSLWVKFRV